MEDPAGRNVPQKTPISLLQELCTKKGLSPQYECLSTEGQVHEPTFTFRVTVNEITAVGNGKSKKVSKHSAAKSLLEQLVTVAGGTEWVIPNVPPEQTLSFVKNLQTGLESTEDSAPPAAAETVEGEAAGGDDDISLKNGVNPVGHLQELCMQKKWPQPIYELISEDGQPHERNFIICCRLGKFSETGEGRSKKTAKRIAAEKMIAFLSQMPKQAHKDGLGGGEEDEDFEARPRGKNKSYFRDVAEDLKALQLGEGGEGGGEGRKKKFEGTGEQPWFGQFPPGESLKKLMSLDLNSAESELFHVEYLRKICREQLWDAPKFIPLERCAKDNQYQCLVQVNCTPLAMSYGSGESAETAKHSAAMNALTYLKLMSQPIPEDV